MRCYLVRHSQTIWNGENRIQGHSDPPLSPLGLDQAKCLGTYFASRPVKALYTSHLMRSVHTAQAIAERTGVMPRIEPALAEIHLGIWEGLTPEEVDARFDGAYQRWQMRPSSVVIPDAEPIAAFRGRVRAALKRIMANFEEGECVVVSHGGVIAALLADLLAADYDALLRRLRLDNASITALECGAGLSHVLWINWTAHLHPRAFRALSDDWFGGEASG